MSIYVRRGLFTCLLACASALAFSGCHHFAAVPGANASPTSSGLPGLTTTTTVTLATNGASVPLSSTGLSATLLYPSNNGGSGLYTLTTVAPSLPGTPTGTPIVYAEFQLNQATNFSGYFSISSVTFPTSLVTLSSSNQVYETLYDQSTGSQIGSQVTGTISGQTVSFGTVASGSFAANASDVYLFVISYQ